MLGLFVRILKKQAIFPVIPFFTVIFFVYYKYINADFIFFNLSVYLSVLFYLLLIYMMTNMLSWISQATPSPFLVQFFKPILYIVFYYIIQQSCSPLVLQSCSPVVPQSCIPVVLQSCTVLYSCSTGLLQSCSLLVMLSCSLVVLYFCRPVVLQFCNPLVMQSCIVLQSCSYLALQSCSPVVLQSCSPLVLQPYCYVVLTYLNLQSLCYLMMFFITIKSTQFFCFQKRPKPLSLSLVYQFLPRCVLFNVYSQIILWTVDNHILSTMILIYRTLFSKNQDKKVPIFKSLNSEYKMSLDTLD